MHQSLTKRYYLTVLYFIETNGFNQTSICETTPGVHSYAGYVNLPDTLLSSIQATPTNISTFFWFFESRADPQSSPLAIWLGGGPGESALDGTFMENGPCYVDDDGLTTSLNDYSLNSVANVIYIDQPSTVVSDHDETLASFESNVFTKGLLISRADARNTQPNQ